MKVVIIGAASLIGESIATVASRETDCELLLISTEEGKTDFLPKMKWHKVEYWDKKEIKKIVLEAKPDVLINCVTVDGVEECERDRNISWALNVDFSAALVSAAKIAEAHYITFSNEILFDGLKGPYSENDPINAYSYYAKSLLARENACKAGLSKFTIFRLTDVFGTSSFEKLDIVSKYMLLYETGIDFEVPASYFSNPIYAYDVAHAVTVAIERNKYGFYHLGGGAYINSYDMVKTIGKIYNYDEELAMETSSNKIIKMGLSTLKAETDLRMAFTTFENALVAMKYNAEGTAGLKYL